MEMPAQDTILKVGNFLDPNTSNDYIFESVKLETATDEIARIESEPVEGGGSEEPIYIRFKSKYNPLTGLDLDTVQVQAFPQGVRDGGGNTFTNIPLVTLEHSPLEVANPTPEDTNILEDDSDEDPERATNIRVICNRFTGSYPTNWARFQGAKQVFNSAQLWQSGVSYRIGTLVTDAGFTYEAITDHTSSGGNQPPSSDWILRTFQIPSDWSSLISYSVNQVVKHNEIAYKSLQNSNLNNEPGVATAFWVRVFFLPTVEYSPLTKGLAQYWINGLAGAKFAATNNAKTAMIDPNVIIDDLLHPRDPVDYVNTNPALIPSELLVNGNIPDAFKMLVIDPATGVEVGVGDFAVPDPNGVDFEGNIAEFRDPDHDGTGEWFVFKQTQTDSEVFDWFEADSWVKDPCQPTFTLGIPDRFVNNAGACTFLAGGAAPRQTVWKKGAYRLSELLFVGKIGVWFEDGQFECVHSVKWDSVNSRIDLGNKGILGDDDANNSAVFVKTAPLDVTRTFPYYVGFNFHSRWPRTSNAIPFGAVTAGEAISLPTFDFNNMFRTSQDTIEWFGPRAEEYYPIQSFAAWMQIIVNDVVLGTFDTEGDYSIKIWMADRNHNVRVIEVPQGRNETIIPQAFALPGEAYKGVPGTSIFLNADEPDTTDAFDPREFVMGGIYTGDSFDTQGRYLGVRSRFQNKSEIELALDGWRMTKPLVVTNVDEPNAKPDRNIEMNPQPRKQSIISYAQAKNYVLGLERWVNFPRDDFIINTGGNNAIKFGDPVYFTDPQMISVTTDGIPNTVKGSADKIVVSLSKSNNGPGGMTSTFHLIPRLYAT